MNKYEKLIKFLRNNGYKLQLSKTYNKNKFYQNYIIDGNGIIGFLSTEDVTGYNIGRYNDCICFDNYEAFNKWSQAPVQLEIYDSEEYYELLLKELQFLASDDGYKLSNEFNYEVKFTSQYEKFKDGD